VLFPIRLSGEAVVHDIVLAFFETGVFDEFCRAFTVEMKCIDRPRCSCAENIWNADLSRMRIGPVPTLSVLWSRWLRHGTRR
jgi:hypothetical protein